MQFGFEKIQDRKRSPKQSLWLPGLCRQRIMGYADSIMELSRELNVITLGEVTKGFDRQSVLEGKMVSDNRDLLCDSLSTIAGLMETVAEEISSYIPFDERKRKSVINALKEEGITVKDIYYLPKTNGKYGIGVDMYAIDSVSSREVSDLLSVLLKRNLKPSVTSPSLVDKNEKVYIFVEESPYIVITGYAKINKNSEKISGDNYSILESEDGKTDLLISDGTGSGEEAFNSSRKAIELLEKMLETGYDRNTAVKMLNVAFCAMEQEKNHPTLDMCSIDLYDGTCEIRKAGAAATFIKRGMDVEILSGVSLPLGIAREAEPVNLSRPLRNGDCVIMVTDGVLDALDEHEYEETLQRIIRTVTEQNPDAIAERLLQTVLCLDGGRILDDMTVLTAAFWEDTRK